MWSVKSQSSTWQAAPCLVRSLLYLIKSSHYQRGVTDTMILGKPCDHRQICCLPPAWNEKTLNLTSEILAWRLVRLTPRKLKCLEEHLFQVALAQGFLQAVQFYNCQYHSISVPSSYFIHPLLKLGNFSNC